MIIKCPHCNGKGFSEINSAVNQTCGWCMGQGELELEIVKTDETNHAWVRSLSTEDFAEWLHNEYMFAHYVRESALPTKERLIKWLKSQHLSLNSAEK